MDPQYLSLLRRSLAEASSIVYDEKTQTLEIKFPTSPTQAELYRLKVVLFFREEINCDIAKVMTISGNTVSINMNNHKLFSDIYRYLKNVSATVLGASVTGNSLEFKYTVRGPRAFLSYDKLDPIQQMVDPLMPNHKSISVMGNMGEYRMTVHTA